MVNEIDLVKKIAKLSFDKKASNILAFDLVDFSDLARYTVICSGSNDRQTKAIANNIYMSLKKEGILPYAVEGLETGNWILLDYGNILVHIFLDYIRNYYALERLWPKANPMQLDFSQEPSSNDVLVDTTIQNASTINIGASTIANNTTTMTRTRKE